MAKGRYWLEDLITGIQQSAGAGAIAGLQEQQNMRNLIAQLITSGQLKKPSGEPTTLADIITLTQTPEKAKDMIRQMVYEPAQKDVMENDKTNGI